MKHYIAGPALCASCRRRTPPNRPARCVNRLTIGLGPLQVVRV